MKTQKVNPSTMNPMEMNNISSMMSSMNLIQKIGKSKRKYNVEIGKNEKKFLAKFLEEAKKQFPSGSDSGVKPLINFFDYLIEICKNKKINEIKLSYEELEFLKKMLSDSVKGMEDMKFKWYQFLKKSMVKVMLKQYRMLLKTIN